MRTVPFINPMHLYLVYTPITFTWCTPGNCTLSTSLGIIPGVHPWQFISCTPKATLPSVHPGELYLLYTPGYLRGVHQWWAGPAVPGPWPTFYNTIFLRRAKSCLCNQIWFAMTEIWKFARPALASLGFSLGIPSGFPRDSLPVAIFQGFSIIQDFLIIRSFDLILSNQIHVNLEDKLSSAKLSS